MGLCTIIFDKRLLFIQICLKRINWGIPNLRFNNVLAKARNRVGGLDVSSALGQWLDAISTTGPSGTSERATAVPSTTVVRRPRSTAGGPVVSRTRGLSGDAAPTTERKPTGRRARTVSSTNAAPLTRHRHRLPRRSRTKTAGGRAASRKLGRTADARRTRSRPTSTAVRTAICSNAAKARHQNKPVTIGEWRWPQKRRILHDCPVPE